MNESPRIQPLNSKTITYEHLARVIDHSQAILDEFKRQRGDPHV